MLAKLKIQCSRCGSEIFITDKDSAKSKGSNGKYFYVIYECPICREDIKVVF